MGELNRILLLKNVRLSFPKFDAPDYFKPGQPSPKEKRRWSASFHVQKTDPQARAIDEMLKNVAKDAWGDKWEQNHYNAMNDPKGCCWVDGRRKNTPEVYILSSHRKEDQGRPLVFGPKMEKIYSPIDEEHSGENGTIYKPSNRLAEGMAGVIYSGCYVHAQVEFWAQKAISGNGIGLRCTLMQVRKFQDGDAFGGGAAVDPDAMAALDEGADDNLG